MTRTYEAWKTKDVRLPFGTHKGKLLTRVPPSYLRTLADTRTDEWRELAALELKRRGTDLSSIEITGHAIDRASTRCLKFFMKTRRKKEGLYSWLSRVAQEAIDSGTRQPSGNVLYLGMKFSFRDGYAAPVLTTIVPGSKHQRQKAGVINGFEPPRGMDDE